MKINLNYLLIVFLLTHLSCNNKTKEETESPVLTDDLKKQINVQNFFNTIPSSIEIFQIIQDTKLNYNPELLNAPTKFKNYSLEKSQSLNLGVYGADLAISGAFNQAQESMLFLKCTNYLAKELGISSAFDENIMDRLEANKENRDSTLEIISQAYKKSDKIFLENKRGELSVYMITGSFIESMYVAGEYALSKPDDTVAFNKIVRMYIRQKESLTYLINLLKNISDTENQGMLNTLININNQLNDSTKKIDVFKKTHELFATLRKQIIHTY